MEYTDEQLDNMREFLAHQDEYTKIILINELIGNLKKENPEISNGEWDRVREFRKEKGWDK